MKRWAGALAAAALVAFAPAAEAHVGSVDAVQDGQAGPYHLLVTIRPPDVVPGIAYISVRAYDSDVARVSVVPLPMSGLGVASAPVADVARRDPDDAQTYDGKLWLMRAGAWQVRVSVEGGRGAGTMSVPVPALARATRPMPAFLIALLVGLLALLVLGLVSIVGASLREADLGPGEPTDGRRIRRARIGMAIAGGVLALAVFGGRSWWRSEADVYRRFLYKPMAVEVTRPTQGTLSLTLSDPGWLRWRRTDDLVPDHGHLMHLFLVRAPGLDAIAHLHPRPRGPGQFSQAIPPLPGGGYRLFGDIVHRTGLDETVSAAIELAGGQPPTAEVSDVGFDARFDADDAIAVIPRAASADAPSFTYADGRGALRWINPSAPRAGETVMLEFEAQTGQGALPAGIEPYMGMAGHAMIVARDFSVFAHIHPNGSVPMAALALLADQPVVDHAHHHGMLFAPRVRFPYVFPHAGAYRVFVQLKQNGRVETAAYDLSVAAAPRAAR